MTTRRFAFAVGLLCALFIAGGGVESPAPVVLADETGGTASDAVDEVLAESGFHGGLVVCVGHHDATTAVALGAVPNALVHALVSPQRLDQVRQQMRRTGLYGRLSATAWSGPHLPYGDNAVNLLVVEDPDVTIDEMRRVLAPLGQAWLVRDGETTMIRKPWPEDFDTWTHARYDATGNAVSKDQGVGPPRYLHWEATPRWNRGVKTSGLVTSRGRLFYILCDSHFASRGATWSIIARDAFSGVELWRRPLASWGGARGGKKVGPVQINRRLVAGQDEVYVTLEEFAPVSVLSAATGELLRRFDATGPTTEFCVSNGVLVALVDANTERAKRRGIHEQLRLVAIDVETAEVLWQHEDATVLPTTVAADGSQVVYHDGRAIQSLDLRTGKPRWTSPPTGQTIEIHASAHPDSPGAEKSKIWLAPQFAPTLLLYGDVVAFAGGRQLNVIAADDGRELWRSDYAATNYSTPVDLFGFGGRIWGPDASMNLWRPVDDDIGFNAYDPTTGVVEREITGRYHFRFQHHRCHQMKVVGDTVLAARAGIEFFDTNSGSVAAHHWTRGSCYFGVLPANGRLYVPPHNCACYVRAKLSGFLAMNALAPSAGLSISDDQRLETGPAETPPSVSAPESEEDWPTYRHDAARSGRSETQVETDLLLGWRTSIGGRLTAPVVANGRVHVASTDTHTLYALDAASGEVQWRVTLDARIDSPPTFHEGMLLCGCRDGSVHALRADDGRRLWRFRGAPSRRLLYARGQLESAWPAHGSVLVADGLAYFTVGRSSYLDGGLWLYGLDPRSGEVVVQRQLRSRHEDGTEILDEEGVDGCLSDILSSRKDRIFLRHLTLDMSGRPTGQRILHLHGADGFLSGATTDRLLWTYAPMFTSPHQGAFYDVRLSRTLFPSGRILVEGEETIYGYGQNHYGDLVTDPGGQWALFAAKKQVDTPLDMTASEYRRHAVAGHVGVDFEWWKPLPIRARAMTLTRDVLFVAGPLGGSVVAEEALEGDGPGKLLAVDPRRGEILAEMTLPCTPMWDGMAAARGNLFVSLADGDVACLWPGGEGRAGTPLTEAAWLDSLPPLQVSEEPGLVGLWRLDEGTGPVGRDASGNGHHAVVAGRWCESEGRGCLVADGAPRALAIPDGPAFRFGMDDFTLALWLQVDDYDTRLIGKEAFPENWWVVNLLASGRAELVLGEGRAASIRPTTERTLPHGEWFHLVAVVDRQSRAVRLYVDGELDTERAIPESMNRGLHARGQDIQIPSQHKPFTGRIGEVRIYRRAISPERVGELFEERPYSGGSGRAS